MRNQFTSSETRYPAHLSLTRTRPTLPRQPSLPVFRTTQVSQQTHDFAFPPRARFNSTVTPRTVFTAQSSVMPVHVSHPPTLVVATESSGPDVERRKLDALVIASGLAGEEDLRADGLAYHSSPSQIYLGEPAHGDDNTSIENKPPLYQSPSSHDGDASNSLSNTPPVSLRSQIITNPHSTRTSISLDDLDEFDEDASYYGKQIDTLFSPYSCPSSATPEAPSASKWSLSSSVEDLGSKRSSMSKSPKNKTEKLKSFISRFSSSGASSSTDKHILPFAMDEKQIYRQRSHSDIFETVTKRSSVSSQVPTVAFGSWESVPPTPTTSFSATSMSICTSYSPVTPNENDNDSNGSASSRHRSSGSNEKYVTPRNESPVRLTRDTSSSSLAWSATNTSVANSPVDVTPPPLMHSVSMASLRTRSLRSFVSRIGLTNEDSTQEDCSHEKKKAAETEAPARRTFRERIMLKNNDSALSLILGIGSSKSDKPKPKKPKRKLLVGGIEKDNYRKYEAISSWCEVSSFRTYICCLTCHLCRASAR